MAEAVLFTIAGKILEALSPYILESVASSWGASNELQRLKDKVGIIKGVLLDADRREHNSEAVKGWLGMARDVMYDADDLADEIATEVLRQELMTRNKLVRSVRIFCSSSNWLIFNWRLANKVEDIRTRLDVILSTMTTFNFVVRDAEEQVAFHSEREQTYSYVVAEEIIGRDDDKEAIIRMLLDCDTQESPSVIPIVGIGGLGKTALAQLIYNDKIIEEHFEVKMWVCVSDDFDYKVIVKNIIRSMSKRNVDGVDFDELIRKLNVDGVAFDELIRKLKGGLETKKYLLVLDDVWNEDHEKWLKLKKILPTGGKGSKIIVTTRLSIVAEIMSAIQKYELKGLSDERSWSLFARVAFRPGQMERDPELVDIGREIIKKCANVPLAIRTIGSLLYSKSSKREWLSIKDEGLSKIEQGRDHILPVLRVSYNHLSSHLKHCFAFCALFPKDYEFYKEQLIQLWIAAGFIQPSNRNQSLEDDGEDCFMLLLRRCFFQDAQIDDSGSVINCKMHDLIHDLAQLVAGKETINVVNPDIECTYGGVHYINFSFRQPEIWKPAEALLREKQLRGLMLPEQSLLSFEIFRSSNSPKFLRVLDLNSTMLGDVPSSICELKHLRWLDLSNTFITSLPNSFTRLLNLQMLDLNYCLGLRKLPRDFGKLVNLRFLDITKGDDFTAKFFFLWRSSQRIRFIKASISSPHKIYRYGNVVHVLTLSGRWEDKRQPMCLKFHHDLLTKFKELPSSVEVLEIKNFYAEKVPEGWMNESLYSLSSLAEVRLKNCLCFWHLPPFRQLPSLKILIIQHVALWNIEKDGDDHSSSSSATFFPSLEELELSNLDSLQGWSKDVEALVDDRRNRHLLPSFPRLSKLRISDCPDLRSMPLVPHVKSLELSNVSKWLSWWWMNESLSLSSLTEVRLKHCPFFWHLPPFRQLSSLKILIIQDMEYLDYIENDSNDHSSSSSAAFFPSLEELELSNLPDLKGWSKEVEASQQKRHLLPSFPLLSKLRISDCPNLTSIPLVPHLKNLHLSNVTERLSRMLVTQGAEAMTINTMN